MIKKGLFISYTQIGKTLVFMHPVINNKYFWFNKWLIALKVTPVIAVDQISKVWLIWLKKWSVHLQKQIFPFWIFVNIGLQFIYYSLQVITMKVKLNQFDY